jgi:ubiquinone/menaquinone biosynthesis C-methylase UbiE
MSISSISSPQSLSGASETTAPVETNKTALAEKPINGELLAGLIRCISKLVGSQSDVRLLDLGCGTGLFTIPLAKNLSYQTIGADCSASMLAEAARKPYARKVTWDQQDAAKLTYRDASFDVVFMSNLLDLLQNPHAAVSECCRVLKPNGVLVYHYGALEDILNDPEHKFFPETVELDHLRTPARKQVETWFAQAKLKGVSSERDTYRPWKTAQERLLSIETKSSAVLNLIDAQSFKNGLARLQAHTADNPMDPWMRELTVTTTYGRK